MLCAARLAKNNSAPGVMKITTVETHSLRESFFSLKLNEYVDATLEKNIRGYLLNL
jgi:hypothetical protein